MSKPAAFEVIPRIDALNRPFRTNELYTPELTRSAVQSYLCSLKEKGYLKADLLVENGERFNLYEKTPLWNAEELMNVKGRRTTQDDSFYKRLSEMEFMGTPAQAAELLGCNKNSIRSLIFQWRARGRDIYIHSWVLTKRGGRPCAMYHFAKGTDTEETKAVYVDEGEDAYRPKSPKESFARGASVVVLDGIKYINPKSTQWSYHYARA